MFRSNTTTTMRGKARAPHKGVEPGQVRRRVLFPLGVLRMRSGRRFPGAPHDEWGDGPGAMKSSRRMDSPDQKHHIGDGGAARSRSAAQCPLAISRSARSRPQTGFWASGCRRHYADKPRAVMGKPSMLRQTSALFIRCFGLEVTADYRTGFATPRHGPSAF